MTRLSICSNPYVPNVRPQAKAHTYYPVMSEETDLISQCQSCDHYFSATSGTALAGLRTLLSRIQLILHSLHKG